LISGLLKICNLGQVKIFFKTPFITSSETSFSGSSSRLDFISSTKRDFCLALFPMIFGAEKYR